jgi:CHASE2 domain-containing sensor protein
LVKVFASTPNLIGIKKVVKKADSDAVEAPPTLRQLGQVSASDMVLDADGKLRRSLLYLKNSGQSIDIKSGGKAGFCLPCN